MYHIVNDLRAKKSAALITEGLYKCLDQKPLKNIKVTDIYANSFVSRATFYRLFDSVYDVLLYQCDLVTDEMVQSISSMRFDSKREEGLYCVKFWLQHEKLIKAIVENNLYSLIYDTILNHREAFKTLYGIDYETSPESQYYVFFLVAMIHTSFIIFYKEKGKRPIEEIMESTNKTIAGIVNAWDIGK